MKSQHAHAAVIACGLAAGFAVSQLDQAKTGQFGQQLWALTALFTLFWVFHFAAYVSTKQTRIITAVAQAGLAMLAGAGVGMLVELNKLYI